MKKLLIPFILLLLFTVSASGHSINPITPVPAALFKPVIITEIILTPKSTPIHVPKPIPSSISKPRLLDKTYVTIIGTASTYGAGYEGFLALPEGPGIKVRITGPGGSIVRISNDAGPALFMQRRGRIIDLDATDFNFVCGCKWYITGIVHVKVEYLSENN